MSKVDKSEENNLQLWFKILRASLKIPGAKINREEYLRKQLSNYYDDNTINKAVELTPKAAGVQEKIIDKLAKSSINWQLTRVTGMSIAAGLPGGWAIAATIPADVSQFYYQAIQLIQKLAYLYGWHELFEEDAENDTISDESLLTLTLFLGVMFGSASANKAILAVSYNISEEVAKRLPRQGLTKYGLYNLAKSIGKWMGVKVTTGSFSKSVAKVVPVLGGVVSGGISFTSMRLMAKRLAKYLKDLPQMTEDTKFKDIDFVEAEDEKEAEAENEASLADNSKAEIEKVKLLINLMKIDKKVTEEEKEFIIKVIEDMNINYEDKMSLIQQFESDEQLKVDFNHFTEVYDKISLITVLLEIAKVDNKFDVTEKIFIKETGKELGLDKEDIDEIIKEDEKKDD